jgi:hypothetical protein
LLDLRAGGIGLQTLVGFAGMGERCALGAALRFIDEVHEIGRAFVERCLEHRRGGPRALNKGFIIAREKPGRPTVEKGVGCEIALKENSRRVLGHAARQLASGLTCPNQAHGRLRPLGRCSIAGGGKKKDTGFVKGLQGDEMVVLRPIWDIFVFQWFVGDGGGLHAGIRRL